VYEIVFLLLFGAVLALAFGLFILCWRALGRARGAEAPARHSGAELELLQRLEVHLQILGSQMTRLAQAQDVLARSLTERTPQRQRPSAPEPAADHTPPH
jgi:hypothetical protein